MKLIKRGVPKGEIVKNQSCRNCNSEFEFTMSDKDIKVRRGDRPFEPDYHYFICSVCESEVYVKK